MVVKSVASAEEHEAWKGWETGKRRFRGLVKRSLSKKQVEDLERAWLFARERELPINQFVTFRPVNIDDLTPPERQKLWQDILNKLCQFGRDAGFVSAFIWSRESDRDTGRGEHLHVALHVPAHLQSRFHRAVMRWLPGEKAIKVRRAYYEIRWFEGKRRTIAGYITKNSPQAAYHGEREYRLGGPIFAKRAGYSQSLGSKAVVKWRADRAREQVDADLYAAASMPSSRSNPMRPPSTPTVPRRATIRWVRRSAA